MRDLAVGDFDAYFRAVHGRGPFPWQSRLLQSVVAEGRWPSLLDLPTGAGKTAVVDIALFHLALDVGRAEATAPRRIVLVVDRRTVVDQAFQRARGIREALRTAPSEGVLGRVRERLVSLTGGGEPLALAHLRGGMLRDDAWARRPDQPLIVTSTVDQVGSRLLFRGYGVSEAMRPVHAGLLGHDTLLFLDEVHLSIPFLETLRGLERYRSKSAGRIPDRWQVVEMSATPSAASDGRVPFRLADDDRADAVLARRLCASKPTICDEIRVAGRDGQRALTFADACATKAATLVTPGGVVGLIVNRVATARHAAERLRHSVGEHADVALVTGRMRPLDRERLDASLQERLRAGRLRAGVGRALVVVSTQCIEAGADYDFDALVTECASIDALRQRFGRLDRLGDLGRSSGIVLVRSDAISPDAADPVYGTAIARTWAWLTASPRDFGIDAFAAAAPTAEELSTMRSPARRAPVTLPAHLDAWSQTRPSPWPDPDVTLWLHGVDTAMPDDVQIVWRSEVTEAALAAAALSEDDPVTACMIERLEACAPVALEALSVPIYAARAWLRGEGEAEVSDVEAGPPESEDRDEEPAARRRALRWRGDGSRVVEPSDLRPGDVLVVPTERGGLAAGTWDPAHSAPVDDLGELARWRRTRRPVLRLNERLHPELSPPLLLDREENPTLTDAEHVRGWLAAFAAQPLASHPWLIEARGLFLKRGRARPAILRFDPIPGVDEGGYYALVSRARYDEEHGEVSSEDDGASLTGVEVTLRAHLEGVARWARMFADHVGLTPALAADVERAARIHDLGKSDPRFQIMLHGGDAVRADAARESLAKSALVIGDRAARQRAQRLSRYPLGARHELLSVAMAQAQPSLLDGAHDPELVLHLVGAHHGWCRPFAPPVRDCEPVEVEFANARVSSDHGLERLDAGVAERFWRLTARYGWYGLAWLEALVRLADHRRSEEEQSGLSEDS